MNRRDFIATSGLAATAVLLAQNVLAEEKAAEAHPPGAHAGHSHPVVPNLPLIQSAAHCLMVGQMCIQHCMMLLSTGDTSLTDCARSVSDMLTVCHALQQLAIAQSPHLPAMAELAVKVCDSCERECRKHENKHAACKACAEACKACAVECRKVAA
ncbi:MAG: four-helix bundle copper-binding protein [Magnetococcales bacterium]|nr:four-helix bundle copper-binding protein [Magnetococcales bacterium]